MGKLAQRFSFATSELSPHLTLGMFGQIQKEIQGSGNGLQSTILIQRNLNPKSAQTESENDSNTLAMIHSGQVARGI